MYTAIIATIKNLTQSVAIMTKTGMRNNLKNMLFERYGKLTLEAKEVEKEVHEKARAVNTTSSVADTWLIDDVINFIMSENEPKKQVECNKQHRAETLQTVNIYLMKYWKQAGYDLSELGLHSKVKKC